MKDFAFEVLESPEGGFEGATIGQRIYTQGEYWDDLSEMIHGAVRCHFDQEMSW